MVDQQVEVSDSTPKPVEVITSNRFGGLWRRRRTWVVDPKLQYAVLFSALIFGAAICLFFAFTARAASIRLEEYIFSLSIEQRQSLHSLFQDLLYSLKLSLGAGLLIFAVGYTALMLVLSNRAAGPIFNLKRKMRLLREKNDWSPARFRKRDFMHDLAEEYNRLLDHLKTERPVPPKKE